MFKLNLKVKKIITLGLITCLIFISVYIPPKKAEAAGTLATWMQQAAQIALDIGKWAWERAELVKELLIRAAADRIIKELTASIVDWINSGFEGGPSFLTNTDQFLQETADIAIGDMLKGSALAFLCDPFKIQVKLSLGLQYQPFQETISCTFTSALANAEGAMNDFMRGDFIGGGGWDSWLQITTVPQNNQMGAMILAQSELDARIADGKASATMELNWGQGFMSYNKCTDANGRVTYGTNVRSKLTAARPSGATTTREITAPSDGGGEVNCEVLTPGTTIANKLNWSDTSVIRKSELANSIDAITNALVNQVIQGMIKGIRGQNTSRPSTTREDNLAELRRLAQAADNSGSSYTPVANNTTYNQTSRNTSFTPEVFTERDEVLRLTGEQITLENEFLAAQNNIYDLLFNTQNLFINSTCDNTIKNNIISELNGNLIVGSSTLPWNMRDSKEAATIASNNIKTLSETRAAVVNVTTDLMVPIIADRLIDMTWHDRESITKISPGGSGFIAVVDWVKDNININRACVGDTSVLSPWGIQ